MRILLVVHGFPPAASGGSEIYTDAYARTLRARFGDDVFVLTREQDPSRPEYATRFEMRGGLRLAWINNNFRRTRQFEETYANPAVDEIASRLIDDFGPDVAHVHHLTCLSTGIVRALDRRRVPVFMTLHDYWLICHRGQLLDEMYRACPGPEPDGCRHCLGPAAGVGAVGFAGAGALRSVAGHLPPVMSRRLVGGARHAAARFGSTRRGEEAARRRLAHMRELCGQVTQFLAPSNHVRQRFIEFGVAAERIRTIECGIERRGGMPMETDSRKVRLGYAGSLMLSKAPHVLFAAFQRLPDDAATLDVFGGYAAYHGDDAYWKELAPWMGNRRIRFHGSVPHAHVGEVMASMDVLVMPSIWPEASPFVIREALDAGVPVVASNIGGIPELVSDGVNGLLCRPGDVDDLHRALSRLVHEPDLIPTLRHGIGPVQTIDADVMFARDLYESARRMTPERKSHPRPCLQPVRVAAIVLSYGPPDDAMLAARSLQASRSPLRIVIVDNGSSEASRTSLASFGDEITVIQTGGNLGFSGGMNVGIRAALAGGATHIFLVNSDMIVPAECVERLLAAIEAHPGAGIAGPAVLSRSRPDRVATLGISYRQATGRMRHRSFDVVSTSIPVPMTGIVDAVSGCAMLVRREVIDAIGLLDEQYFFSFEDLDWCFRARGAGFATLLVGDAVAYHEGARSIGTSSPRRLYYAARNHLRFASSSGDGHAGGKIATFWRGSSIVALNLAHAVRASGGSMPARIGAVVRGTRDHLAGRYGELRDPVLQREHEAVDERQ